MSIKGCIEESDEVKAAFAGLEMAASQQVYATPFHVYTLLEMCQAHAITTDDLKRKLPAALLKDSVRFPLEILSRLQHRVSKEAVQHVVELCHDCHQSEVFPAQWWQVNVLQTGSRVSAKAQNECLSHTEQVLWAARVAAEVRKVVKEHFKDLDPEELPAQMRSRARGVVEAEIPKKKRDQWRELARSFASQALTIGYQWSQSEEQQLVSDFAGGLCDMAIRHAPSSATSWGSVKTLLKQRKAQRG